MHERFEERIITNSFPESFSNALKGVFVGCGRITAKPECNPKLGSHGAARWGYTKGY
jgi:hypothetical protein